MSLPYRPPSHRTSETTRRISSRPRTQERYRSRVESSDGPKAWLMAAAVGAAFGGGLIVAEARGSAPVPSEVSKQSVDDDTARHEKVKAMLALRYHQELRADEPALPMKAAEDEKAAAVAAKAGTPASPKPTSVVKPTPKAALEPVSDDDAPPTEDAEGRVVEDFADTPAAPVEQKQTEDNSARLAAALNRVLGEDAPAPAAPAPAAAKPDATPSATPAAPGPGFLVQVASLPARTRAEALVDQLRQSGLSAKVARADLGDRGEVFRVVVTGFQTRDAATGARETIRDVTGLTGLVREAR